jgi:hypothetical protein
MPRVFAWEKAHRMFAGRLLCWSQRAAGVGMKRASAQMGDVSGEEGIK